MKIFHIFIAIFTIINIINYCCLVIAKRSDEQQERYIKEKYQITYNPKGKHKYVITYNPDGKYWMWHTVVDGVTFNKTFFNQKDLDEFLKERYSNNE